jgi:taurine dioxygenase
MVIEVIPTGAAIAAEIRGVNLAHPLDDATFAKVEEAYNTHGVIFFRNQRLTPPQQVAFTRCFGEIELNIFGERWSVPGNPQIVVVSNVTEEGRAVGVRRAGENWHSDMCYTAQPPRGTMLYAIEVPELHGLTLGDTEFASAQAAWEALPDPLRHRIDGRNGTLQLYRWRATPVRPARCFPLSFASM